VLVDGPFNGWRLPGLLLGGLVGVGYLAAGTVEHGRYRHSAQISAVAGAGLVCFEAVEWRWLGFHPPAGGLHGSRRRRHHARPHGGDVDVKAPTARLDLYWLPLGAGGHSVG
jgi:hypothetical protein